MILIMSIKYPFDIGFFQVFTFNFVTNEVVMETVLNFESFELNTRVDLIFSIFENLRLGQEIKIICNQSPRELELKFQQMQVRGLEWKAHQLSNHQWEVSLKKSAIEQSGCCGVCGHDKE